MTTDSDKDRVAKAIYDNVVEPLQRENERLRQWIKNEWEQQDICTFDILGTICEWCRCPRQSKAK